MLQRSIQAVNLRVLARETLQMLPQHLKGLANAFKHFGLDMDNGSPKPATSRLSEQTYTLLYKYLSLREPLRWASTYTWPPSLTREKLSPFSVAKRTVQWQNRTFSAQKGHGNSYIRYSRSQNDWACGQIVELFTHDLGQESGRRQFAVVQSFAPLPHHCHDMRQIRQQRYCHRMSICSDQLVPVTDYELISIEQIDCHIAFRKMESGKLEIPQDFLLVVCLMDYVVTIST